jgi:N6-adenosine-specific RNA methylase IME4/anti-sigma28 factor (negative regulator of flagellin synthesis)
MQNLSINPELKALIPPLTSEEFAQLEANVCQEGIREPIITWQGTIVDGHNRYELAQMYDLPFKVKEMAFTSMNHAKKWMAENQLGRRNLHDFVKGELNEVIEECIKAIGREKQLQTLKQGQESPDLSIIDKSESHDTRKIVAEKLGWSTGKKAMFDVVKKKAPEEIKEKLRQGEVSINQAYQEIKKEEKKAERDKKIEEVKQKIESENLVQPNKKYHVIAIDPPWAYSEKGGFSSDDYDATSNRGAVDYPTMTVEQIAKIELPTADDCVIFLWTTHAFLRDSFELLDNWGFNYKATLVWDKVKMGLGRTIRMQVEFCLIGVKGNPIINGSSERDIITEPRREHSRKPEAFYQMAERMCIGNRLDFFSRQNRENWDHYGAESGQF